MAGLVPRGKGIEEGKLRFRSIPYVYGVLLYSAPWIVTLCAFYYISHILSHAITPFELSGIRSVFIYLYSFTLVFSSPAFSLATRVSSDLKQAKRSREGLLLAIKLSLLNMPVMLLVSLFMVLVSGVDSLVGVISIVFLVVFLGTVWVVGAIVQSYEYYLTLLLSYSLSFLFVCFFVEIGVSKFGGNGVFYVFSAGYLILILLLLFRLMLIEDVKRSGHRKNMPLVEGKLWIFLAASMVYVASFWVDKWIVWYQAGVAFSVVKLPTYPIYDSAMFMVCLFFIPGLYYVFRFLKEEFSVDVGSFISEINQGARLSDLEEKLNFINQGVEFFYKKLFVFSFMVAFALILGAEIIVETIGASSLQKSLLKQLFLGGFFQFIFAFNCSILWSLRATNDLMFLCLIYIFVNAALTWVFSIQGFEYYGVGYSLSSILAYCLSDYQRKRYMKALLFHVFMSR